MTNLHSDRDLGRARRVLRSPRALLGGALVPLLAMALPLLAGCPRGDVGAPCNHGDVEAPESKLVTFPALACNDLLCVYADEKEAPEGGCTSDQECNEADPDVPRFQCVMGATGNTCQLRLSYVLERSMCSKKCSKNSDCENGGPTKRIVVDDSACGSGFSCARIQTLGKFCCEKLCVCNDDLGVTEMIDQQCSGATQVGCCDQNPVPEACGKP